MKKYRVLTAALAGIFVYVLISVIGGRDGLIAERQQNEQRRILSARLEAIQKINDSLQLECTALENDQEVIAGLAKKIGYVSSGDKIVIINGLYDDDIAVYEAGTPLKAKDAEYLPEYVGKILGIFVFLIVLFFMFYKDYKNGEFRKNKKTFYVEGVPVYDLPQI